MKGKRIIISAAVIASLTGVCLIMTAAIGGPKKFSVGEAAIGDISENVDATGDVHGMDSMTYYSEVTAPVNFYKLHTGDTVSKGEKAVGYDLYDLTTLYDKAVLSAKAAENTMNGQVEASDTNQKKFNKAKSDIDTYRQNYALFRLANDYVNQGQYQENWDINCIADGITKNIAQKEADLGNKTIELQNAQAKQDQDAVNSLTDDIEKLNKDIANLNSDLAGLPPTTLSPEEYAQTVINGNWMSDIMRNWTETSTLKNTYENQILNDYQKDQLRNTYDLSELGVENAAEDLAKGKAGVNIEYDGIVTESFISDGSVVQKGSPLFAVESSKDMKVDCGISKYDIGKIEKGQKAEVNIAGNKYTGSVFEIKRFAEAKDSDKAKVTVSVKIDEPDDRVYIGLEADVTIFTNAKAGVLTIPTEAHYADDGGDYCYTITDGKVAKQYIAIGSDSGERIEVTGGLQNGDIVITDAITDDSIGKRAEPEK
ncbi:MAG: HlyD family efflux transporter periplasmic adaptor subunit [Lachnospiraceae bacterium]|nr:HlyD family efflux transporter periplasmic adaptor subunit [Lachnospiraceae bacterium]